ncbi:Cytochrome p450, partial [Globisporangium splendens]
MLIIVSMLLLFCAEDQEDACERRQCRSLGDHPAADARQWNGVTSKDEKSRSVRTSSGDLVVLSTEQHFEDVLKTQFEIFDKGEQMHSRSATPSRPSMARNGDTSVKSSATCSRCARSFRETITADIQKHVRLMGTELLEKLPRLFTNRDYVPSLEEVEELVYLEAALRESLRLNLTVPLNAKEANRDTTLSDGTFLKKGTRVYIPSYAFARMPYVWGPGASKYKPERWIEINSATGKQKLVAYPVTKFPSFHAGSRICLGMRFAIFELKTSLAYMLSKYGFTLAKNPRKYTYKISTVVTLEGSLMTTVEEIHA